MFPVNDDDYCSYSATSIAFTVCLRSHVVKISVKLIKPIDGQALHFDSHISKTSFHFSPKHHNNTYHFHIQVCYSNVIVLSHVSLICVNILMARNMVSFDRASGLCVISQITYYLRPNHLSVHKKINLSLMKWNIAAHVLTCYSSHDYL